MDRIYTDNGEGVSTRVINVVDGKEYLISTAKYPQGFWQLAIFKYPIDMANIINNPDEYKKQNIYTNLFPGNVSNTFEEALIFHGKAEKLIANYPLDKWLLEMNNWYFNEPSLNLDVYLGKLENGEDFRIDLSKQNINLILLLGSTGSGKSIFHFNLYRELINQNNSDQLKFILIDNTHVEFPNFPKSIKHQRITDNKEGIKALDEVLNELKARKGNPDNKPALWVHIEECDLWAIDLIKVERFFKEFKANSHGSNIFVVYSTSRPSVDVLPDWLIESSDINVIFKQYDEFASQRVIGNNLPVFFTKPGQRIALLKNKFCICQPFNDQELKEIQDFENQELTNLG